LSGHRTRQIFLWKGKSKEQKTKSVWLQETGTSTAAEKASKTTATH